MATKRRVEPPPLSGVKVEVSINVPVNEAARLLDRYQLSALMGGIASVIAASQRQDLRRREAPALPENDL